MALKHKFALYQKDSDAYKANRNTVRERFYAAWKAEDKANEERKSRLGSGTDMDMEMGEEAGEDAMELD